MNSFPEGNAIIFCEKAFSTTYGKTAHGLVRRSRRYHVLSVVDGTHAGGDAGVVLDNKPKGIPIVKSIQDAFDDAQNGSCAPTHLVIGLAPDGGRISKEIRKNVIEAIHRGLNVDSGLHDFLSEDPEIALLAEKKGVEIRDVRKTPPRNELHFFSGKIEEVTSLKVAVLGTDSAVGKRTTAWMLIDALEEHNLTAQLIGTGQTAWMQGARYGILLDSLINDFVSGEIEHAVWSAWKDVRPDILLIEGQGSLMNPAYPGGHEILAAGRPDVVILQHAPGRVYYDGFQGYPIHPLERQIQAIELLSDRPVVAVTVNHENLKINTISDVCNGITAESSLLACDPLLHGLDKVVTVLEAYLNTRK